MKLSVFLPGPREQFIYDVLELRIMHLMENTLLEKDQALPTTRPRYLDFRVD